MPDCRYGMTIIALGACLWFGQGISLAQPPALSVPPLAIAPDGVMMDETSDFVELLPYSRAHNGQLHFVLNNMEDKVLSLELELVRLPKLWPWVHISTRPRLRLWDSEGREFLASAATPERLVFTLPMRDMVYFILTPIDGTLSDVVALRLWGGVTRQAFVARIQALRQYALYAVSGLYIVGLFIVLARWSFGGLLTWMAGASTLLAYVLQLGLSMPFWLRDSLGMPSDVLPMSRVWSFLAMLLAMFALAVWLGFNVYRRQGKWPPRLAAMMVWIINFGLGCLLLLILVMQSGLGSIFGLSLLRTPLYMEVLLLAILVALGLGNICLSITAKLPRRTTS